MNKKTMAVLIVALAGLLAWSGGSDGGGSLAQGEGGVAPQAVLTPLLQYQGRLTNPSTGEPVVDGNYTMTFRLYDVDSGGSALWTETKDVPVADGLFNTALGDVTALDQSLFNGQALWLGVKVGADGEATPRQQVLAVAYALSLVPGAVVEANSSSPVLEVNNTGSGDALQVGGDLSVSGSLSGGSHNHSGAHITSGTVADARVASTIARDSEIVSTVLANDGAGSGLDADLLDGSHASAFAGASHTHDTRYYTEGESDGRFVNTAGPDGMAGNSVDPILEVTQNGSGVAGFFASTTSYGVQGETASTSPGQAGVMGVAGWTGLTPNQEVGVLGKSSNGMGVAGVSDNQFGVYGLSTNSYGVRGDANGGSAGVFGGNWGSGYGVYGYSVNSYGGYFNSSSGLALYAAGDAEVTGELTVDRVIYSSPRTHYFVVGGEAFVPDRNVDYISSSGCGGAYVNVTPGAYRMVAPVHLPHGAVVTEFEVFFYDTSSNNMTVALSLQILGSCGFSSLAQVVSSGTSGYYSLIDNTISSPTINNRSYSYHVDAYANPWGGSSLKIKGAVITYTINEAP